MRACGLLVFATAAFLVAGCARMPLVLEKDGAKLAPSLGVNSEDLQFIGHVWYTMIPDDEQKPVEAHVGIAALTGTDLILRKADGDSSDLISIPVQHIRSVAKAPNHLEVNYQGETLAVRLYQFYTDYVDEKQTERFYYLLVEESIPKAVATGFRGLGRTINDPPIFREATTHPDTHPEDYDLYYRDSYHSRDRYQKQPEYPEPLYPVQFNDDLNGTPPPYPPGQYPTTGQ